MFSGRGLCDELISRPEESYRLCCVVVCDLETSRMGAPYIYDISRLRLVLALLSVIRNAVQVCKIKVTKNRTPHSECTVPAQQHDILSVFFKRVHPVQ